MADGSGMAARAGARDRVVIVGAGVAGLAAAMELSAAGREVVVLEAAAGPGGKMRAVPSAAGEIDAGPTVFTQREVFEALFAAAGTSLEAELTVRRAELLSRNVWPDGATLDLFDDPARCEAAVEAFAGPAEAARFRAFDARCRRLFEAFEGPVMAAERPTPLGVAKAVAGDALRLTRDMAPLSTLWDALGRQFRDPRLRQLFARFSTYVGGSPFLSPALLMLIWRSEAKGVWTVEGGMRRLARTMAAVAERNGARLRYGAPVSRIAVEGGRVRGVIVEGGERIDADEVVFAGDPAALAAGLPGRDVQRSAPAMPRARRSLSAWVWTWAAEPEGLPLSHHTVFFSHDYRAEFEDLDRRRRPPEDPSLYVCAQDRAAAPGAEGPGGPERLLMILNAPADGDLGPPSLEEIERCTTTSFARLAAAGLRLSPPDLSRTPEALTTPDRFAAMFPATGGALYGANPHGALATFRRPTARSPVPGLYLAGGGCHPGPGVPMATRSGRRAAEAIMADRASTSASTRTATRGGTSTG